MTSALNGVLLGLGNPLLDISAPVDDTWLTRYDLKTNNAILCEKKHEPIYAELVSRPNVEYIAGGAAQNTIRVAQWMLQIPGATGYTGCVGNDNYSAKLREVAAKDNVTLHYMVEPTVPTGTCACLIINKERSLVANLAAANHFKTTHLETDEMKTVLARAQYFYIEGYFITSGFAAIQHIADHCKQTNKRLAMNLSAPFLALFFNDQLNTCLQACDFVFGNESEAETWGKKHDMKDLSIGAIALRISALPKNNGTHGRVVVITQGDRATVVAKDGVVTSYPVPPLDAKLIVDVNGAGDAFCGGFMSQLVKGRDIPTCVSAGHYAARCILQVSGTALNGTPQFTAQ
jgi:adenosine kinase